MQTRIMVLAPKHFCDYLQMTDERYHLQLEQKYKISYCNCEKVGELTQEYERLWEETDGFCVAGSFTRQLLIKGARKSGKPIGSISARSMEYYREFFFRLDNDRTLDLNRVILDAFLWGGDMVPRTVRDFEKTDRLLDDIRQELIRQMSIEDILNMEKVVLQRAREIWNKGEADLFLCRQASVYPLLKAEGIPCSFVYPAPDMVRDSIELLASRIKLEQMEDELPAVISIRGEESAKRQLSGIDQESLEIQRAILEFDKEMTAGFIIRQIERGCEIYTTRQTVKRITDNFTICKLRQLISSQTGLFPQIGYGLGQTVMRARFHAFEACEISKKNGGSYLMAEDGSLTGPLNENSVMKVAGTASDSVLTAAERSGLSISTVQRVISAASLLGRDELTTQELASALQVTVANANRFLNALEKAGFAEITSERKSFSKGRPSRVYRLKI